MTPDEKFSKNMNSSTVWLGVVTLLFGIAIGILIGVFLCDYNLYPN